jgi:predicted MFS family arabinose efflux permease
LPVVLAGFLAFLDLYLTQPLLPLFSEIFHASTLAASMTVTATTVAVAIAAPFAGRLADMWGSRRVIVWASAALTLSTFLAATAKGLTGIIFWRFVQGLCTPGVHAVSIAYIHEHWPVSRVGRTSAVYLTGNVVGGFAGRMTAGVVAAHLGWRASFVVLGVANLMCALGLALWLPHDARLPHRAKARSHHGSLAAHLRNGELLVTYMVGFCVLFTMVATFTYVTFRLAEEPFRLSSAAIGSLFAVYLIGGVITPFAGRWIDVYGHRTAIVGSMALGASGALLTLVPSLVSVMAGLALVSTGVFLSQATATSHVGTTAGHNRGLAVGLYSTFYYIGGSAGASLPALFWARGGWSACVALVVVVQMVSAAVALAFWRDLHGPVDVAESGI